MRFKRGEAKDDGSTTRYRPHQLKPECVGAGAVKGEFIHLAIGHETAKQIAPMAKAFQLGGEISGRNDNFVSPNG
jgi:hypothetical protein